MGGAAFRLSDVDVAIVGFNRRGDSLGGAALCEIRYISN